jgi:lipopolysaccharide heptosyltransferase II
MSTVRAHWPGGHLTVLCRERVRQVIERNAEADEFLDERRHEVAGLARRLRAGCFDVAFALSSSQAAAAAMALARIPVRVGFRGGLRGLLFTTAVDPVSRYIHRTRQFLMLATAAGAKVTREPRPAWKVLKADRAEAARFLRKHGIRPGTRLAAFAPGASYGPSNRWFAASWAGLADRLTLGGGWKVVMVGGPAEVRMVERATGLRARRAVVAAGRLSLGGTAALISVCRACVSNDSGLMHVGAALGVPTLGLISSGNPAWTGPVGRRAAFLWARVPCSPCFRRTCLPGRGYACLRELTVDLVHARLLDLIKGK